MVPAALSTRSRTPGLFYTVASLIVNNVPKLLHGTSARGSSDSDAAAALTMHTFAKRHEKHNAKFIVFACLIPILVLLSGLFAGLTLGYMSLDETQLHVLSVSGTPKQKEYAKKIEPIRKNGHLLLVTLLLANMIVNETLPVVSDPVLGGGVQSVVGIVSWPVAKLLEFILGSSHGIMYRRAELKELIAMHSTTGELGGDLKHDTVTIIGATLDLQEKVVKQAMTPIDKVFMLNHDCKLDYDTMKQIAQTGHSRVPVYEEIDVPLFAGDLNGMSTPDKKDFPLQTQKVKKIVGILLVKQCLMLDPRDATPLRKLHLNRVINVPNNMSLLAILDRFQEGRSHMAIVSRFSEEKAASIKHVVKKGLTQRLMERVGMGDSSSSESESDSDSDSETESKQSDDGVGKKRSWKRFRHKRKAEADLEKGESSNDKAGGDDAGLPVVVKDEKQKELELPETVWEKLLATGREQKMPDDAVLTKEDAKGFLQNFDPAVAPLGIITLEDVLEELIGEEIYDEFDREGQSHLDPYYTSRRMPSRARTPDPKISPDPSDGATAIGDEESKSHSMPASPMIGTVFLDEPQPRNISRVPSLGQHLGALAGYKRQLRSSSGSSTPRERSRVRRQSNLVPSAPAPLTERVPNVQEESAVRIPDSQEKSGPDIPKPQEGEKEQEKGKEE
ncbi:hypothetical protein EIP86_003397 [Pleurotus ostreatoroseus]|nr:hypothetical protein EIP86_003397 [Pleurotus ostreatoroseus]